MRSQDVNAPDAADDTDGDAGKDTGGPPESAAEAAAAKCAAPVDGAKLSPKRARKQRSWSANECSVAATSSGGRRVSALQKIREEHSSAVTLAHGETSKSTRMRGRSASAAESHAPRKKPLDSCSTLSTASNDCAYTVPTAFAPSYSDSGESGSISLRSTRTLRQVTKTKILAGVDPHTSLAKKLSAARLTRTASKQQLNKQDNDNEEKLNNLASLSLHDNDEVADNASHFFSIETRLELKERLVALQQQLNGLLVATKLAWMKCFASDSEPHFVAPSPQRHHSSTTCATPKAALVTATDIVTKGETLAMNLQLAFAKAVSTSNCPIKEYEDLVARVETEFQEFQTFVSDVAHRSFATAQHILPIESTEEPVASPDKIKATEKHHAAMSFDLPSMKRYCAKVAPPYSSYLNNKK